MLAALKDFGILLTSVVAVVITATAVLLVTKGLRALYWYVKTERRLKEFQKIPRKQDYSTPGTRTNKCPQCGQPKLYPGMACYGNENQFHRLS